MKLICSLLLSATTVFAQQDSHGSGCQPRSRSFSTAMPNLCGLQMLTTRTVGLRGPIAATGSTNGLSMSVQIGENRVYNYDNRAGISTLKLGQIERGWTTFRFYDMKVYSMRANGGPVLVKGGLACSGGFTVDNDKDFEFTVVLNSVAPDCRLR